MYTVKFYLDNNSNTKKGHPIRIEVYCDKTKLQKRRKSGFYQKRKSIKMTPELTRLLGELQNRTDYANRLNLGFDDALEVIVNGYSDEKEKKLLKERLIELERKDTKLLVEFIGEMIIEREAEKRSTRHFEELIRELEKWDGGLLYINDITYQKLKEYELFKRLNSNTNGSIIVKTIRTLRTVFNEARRRGLVHNLSIDPFEGLKIMVDSKPKRKAITKENLKAFKNFIPKKSTTEKNKANMMRARDLFMFQIYIGGHDMADVANLKWSDFHEVDGVERIRFQRFKLRSRNNQVWIDNVLLPEAKKIIDSYGTPDEERVFGWLADPITESYKQQNGYQRKTLGRICETMGINKFGTKIPRSIFRSVGGQLGVNEILIHQLMGHKPPSVSYRYQQDMSLEAQDEAHRNIVKELFTVKVNKPKKGVLMTEEEVEAELKAQREAEENYRNPNFIYLS